MKLFRLSCYFILISFGAALPAIARNPPLVLKRELPPEPPAKFQRVYLADSSISVDMPSPVTESDRVLVVGGRELHFRTRTSFPPITETNLNTQYIIAYADIPEDIMSKDPSYNAARLIDDVHEAYFGVPKTVFKPLTQEERNVGNTFFKKMSVKLPDTDKIVYFVYIFEHNRVYLISVLAESPNFGVENFFNSLEVTYEIKYDRTLLGGALL